MKFCPKQSQKKLKSRNKCKKMKFPTIVQFSRETVEMRETANNTSKKGGAKSWFQIPKVRRERVDLRKGGAGSILSMLQFSRETANNTSKKGGAKSWFQFQERNG